MLGNQVVVAGHDLDAHAQPVQPSERAGGVSLDRVAEDQEPRKLEVSLVLRADRFQAGRLSHADGNDPGAGRELRVENWLCPVCSVSCAPLQQRLWRALHQQLATAVS